MTLSELEQEVLVDLKVHGTSKPSHISGNIERPRSSISRIMSDLTDEGYVENKGSGVYRLTDKGRNQAIRVIEADLDIYS